MRRTILLLVATVLSLSACASARQAATPAPRPRSTVVFPARLPAGTAIAYAVRQGALFASTLKATVAGTIQSLAVTGGHRASLSCRTGMPMAAVGMVRAATAGQWSQLLDRGHVGADRSDALNPQTRSFWFVTHGRVVYLNLARHVHGAPCRGTACAAALEIDSTLQAAMPAIQAMSGFIAAHCPA